MHTITKKIFLFFLMISFFIVKGQIKLIQVIGTKNGMALDMDISEDNRFAYVAVTNSIQVYKRSISTGKLNLIDSITQMSSGVTLFGVVTLKLSADQKYLYAKGVHKSFVFARDSLTGLLTPYQTLSDGYFGSGSNISNNNIVPTKNNKHVYILSREDMYIYERDNLDSLSFLTKVSYDDQNGFGDDLSMVLDQNERLAFITVSDGVKIYTRDTITGMLTIKDSIYSAHLMNEQLSYSQQSSISRNDNFIYTATMTQGSGALVVIKKDQITDSLSIVQTIYTDIHPGFISLSGNGALLVMSSGVGGSNPRSTCFYEIDTISGFVRLVSRFENSYRYLLKKHFDKSDTYFYATPFVDSIYVYKIGPILKERISGCTGDSVQIKVWKDYQTQSWSNGSTADNIWVNNPGVYSVMVEDELGFIDTDSVEVVINQKPIVFLGNDTSLYLNKGLNLSPGWYYTSWLWNDSSTFQYLSVFNDSSYIGVRTYSVLVTDSNGCTNSDSINITFHTGHLGISLHQVDDQRLYPNPVNSFLHLDSKECLVNQTVQIINAIGNIVSSYERLNGNHFIFPCDELSPGIYYLSIPGQSLNKKFFVFR